jgi:ATP-dependent RNA helicase RhlE
MLDMGFAPQVEKILKNMTRERQTMLFSATMPGEIMRMIKMHMKLPVHVEMAPSGTTAEGITQELYIVKREKKIDLLDNVLSEQHGSVLLFTRTKHHARKIAKMIRSMGHRATEIHSDKSMAQRREALEGFKSGRYRILVATDIASRGIDVKQIEIVINYDLPDDVENYVHRIGRTGRAGNKGKAISFATPDQSRDVKNIERLIKKQLPIVKHPDVPSENFGHFEKSSKHSHKHHHYKSTFPRRRRPNRGGFRKF